MILTHLLGHLVTKMIDIIETVYRGASKGRGLVVAPKGEENLSAPLGMVFHTFTTLY